MPEMWQDYVIGIGQFVFAAAMLPSIFGQEKPAFWSCLLTAFGLSVFGACFGSLHLWLSMAGSSTTALAWWVLVRQTARVK